MPGGHLADALARWKRETFPRAAAKLGQPDADAPTPATPLDLEGHDFARDVGLPGEYPFTAWSYWLQHRWLHFHTLDPLPSSGVEQMLATLSDHRTLTPSLRALVHQRAGGVPLFVEELTRALI